MLSETLVSVRSLSASLRVLLSSFQSSSKFFAWPRNLFLPSSSDFYLISAPSTAVPLSLRPPAAVISIVSPTRAPSSSLIHCKKFQTLPPDWGPNRGCRNPAEVERVLEVFERHASDIEVHLGRLDLDFSADFVAKVVESMSERRISALRFFTWVRKMQTSFIPKPEVYNLVVNNLGLLGDFDSMLTLLRELSTKRHCLTERTFAFLYVYSSNLVQLGESVKRLVETLNGARGSCRSSGIYSLIKVLSDLNHSDFAIFVIEETARRTSYYNILIAAKCKMGSFEEAPKLFDEMRNYGCDPNVKSYNYLLGSLCKRGHIAEGCQLLETMEGFGYLPDAITFEVLAVHACRLGRIEYALDFLYHMLSEGIQPRLTTHAAFIKGYFWSGRHIDAHAYVVDMSEWDRYSRCMNYSLLARLFYKSGRLEEAHKVLVEMIDRGLKPNFLVYANVKKDLYRRGKGNLVADLQGRYLKFWQIGSNKK